MNSLADLLRCLRVAEPAPPVRPRRQQRRRRRKARRAQLAIAAPVAGVAPLPQRAPRRQRAKRGRNAVGSLGEVAIRRSEFLASSGTAKTGSVFLTPANFPWLSNVAKAFERVRWLACSLEWRPNVGTTEAGSYAIGMDWGQRSTKLELEDGRFVVPRLREITKPDVLAMTPVVEHPIWQGGRITLPQNLLNSRQWYDVPTSFSDTTAFDAGPGALAWAHSGSANAGDLWLHYHVLLQGTRKV